MLGSREIKSQNNACNGQAANCSYLPDKERGIALHPIPFLTMKERRQREDGRDG